MFPNMPKDIGIMRCREELNKRPCGHGLPTDCIIEALEICLDYNIGEFDGEWLKQMFGAAMGPHEACFYCDLAMSYIDKIVNSNDNPHKRPTAWDRFRDDIYDPWTHGETELLKFKDWLNTLHPNIQFTCTYSEQGVEFLETYVYDVDGVIHTKIFSKDSDTHCYLPPTSCHPYHIIKNNPSQIARRVRKLNSEEKNYVTAREKFSRHLIERGYSTSSVTEAFEKFNDVDRTTLYNNTSNTKAPKKCYPLVTEFNPHLPKVTQVLNKHKHILEMDKHVSEAIPQDSIFASFYQPKSIKDLLIHSKFTSTSTTPNDIGCISCNKCYFCCNFLIETKTFKSYETSQQFHIKQGLTCLTEGVIYLILDQVCHRSYIGSTIDHMRKRVSNYKSHIKTNFSSCEMAQHFAEFPDIHKLDMDNGATKSEQNKNYEAGLAKQLKFIIIEAVDLAHLNTTKDKREAIEIREGYWQTQLRTMRRYGGLNKKDDRKLTNRRLAGISSSQPKHTITKSNSTTVDKCTPIRSSCPTGTVRRSSRIANKT